MKLICIEGIDAVGKETVSKALEKTLDSKGFKVFRVAFPFYEGDFGRCIKDVLMGACGDAPDLDPELMGPLYALDRIAYFKSNIDRLLSTYDYLICDRSFYSNFMYQAAKIYIKNPLLYSNCDIAHPLANWISKNFAWEFDETGLFKCTDVNTFVLTLSEEDSLKQLNNRAQKDTNETNRAYLAECKKFITHMMSDNVRAYADEMMEHLSLKVKHHILYYITNVHAIEVEHADNPEDIVNATMRTVNKIMRYLFPDENLDDDIDYKKFYNDFAKVHCLMASVQSTLDNAKFIFDANTRIDHTEFLFNLNSRNPLKVKVVVTGESNKYPRYREDIEAFLNQYISDKTDRMMRIDWNTFFDNKFDTPLLFTYDGKDFTVKKFYNSAGE